MAYNLDRMETKLAEWNIELSKQQKEQFITYYEMLVEKNKVMNLTAITEFDEVVEKHFLDSISLTMMLDLHQNMEVLDLGTGAGFPGIPLKIIFPELHITLADSLNKRILFLDEVIEELQLKDIRTIHSRAEEMARNNDHREKYDLCVSRAVANLATLSEYCLPFVKVGGSFISYKSGDIDEEIKNSKNAIFLLGGKLQEVKKFSLTDGEQDEIHRSFVNIMKKQSTPKTYPRKAGTPSKNPL